MAAPEIFRFDEYKVPDDVKGDDIDALCELAHNLTDALIAFVAAHRGEEAPERAALMRNRDMLAAYIGTYNDLVRAGKIVETAQDMHLPCGETPAEVVDRYRVRCQRGLDGALLVLPNAENLSDELIAALRTLPPTHRDMLLRKPDILPKYSPELVRAIGDLSENKLKALRSIPPGYHPGSVRSFAKLDDQFAVNLDWGSYHLEKDCVSVIEAFAESNIPVNLLKYIRFGEVSVKELTTIRDGMTDAKWEAVRVAAKGTQDRLWYSTIIDMAQLGEEEFVALGDLAWVFSKRCRSDHGSMFQAVREGNFTPARIESIGGQNLMVLHNLSHDGNYQSIVQTLGRMTDEQIAACGGVEHILDLALGRPITRVEARRLIAEIDLTFGNMRPESDHEESCSWFGNNRPYADSRSLRLTVNRAARSGLRVGESNLLLVLEQAFRSDWIGRGYRQALLSHSSGYGQGERQQCPPGRLRLAAFCNTLMPEAKEELAWKLKRIVDGTEEASRLESKHNREIMDPESPLYPVEQCGVLVRKPVFERYRKRLQASHPSLPVEVVQVLGDLPVERDTILDDDIFDDLDLMDEVAREYSTRRMLTDAEFCPNEVLLEFLRAVREHDGLLAYVVESGVQPVRQGELQKILEEWHKAEAKRTIASRPKVSIYN